MFQKPAQTDTPKILPHKITGYVDSSGEFSNRSLTSAEWYLKHKIKIHKILLIALVVGNILLWGYSIYGWGRYFFFDYTNADRTLVGLSAAPLTFPHLAPNNVQLQNAQAFQNSSDTYDFVVEVNNPNKNWKAKVTYNFSYTGGASESISAEVFPGSKELIAQFGISSPSFPINIQAHVQNIEWERVDSHIIPDPVQFRETRLKFSHENVVFEPANESEGIVSHSISFDIVNDSVYGYWAPAFDVIFLNNQSPIGIQRIQTEAMRPADKKHIELKSFASQLRVTDVQIVPRIDIFDQTEYIAPGE